MARNIMARIEDLEDRDDWDRDTLVDLIYEYGGLNSDSVYDCIANYDFDDTIDSRIEHASLAEQSDVDTLEGRVDELEQELSELRDLVSKLGSPTDD